MIDDLEQYPATYKEAVARGWKTFGAWHKKEILDLLKINYGKLWAKFAKAYSLRTLKNVALEFKGWFFAENNVKIDFFHLRHFYSLEEEALATFAEQNNSIYADMAHEALSNRTVRTAVNNRALTGNDTDLRLYSNVTNSEYNYTSEHEGRNGFILTAYADKQIGGNWKASASLENQWNKGGRNLSTSVELKYIF